MVDQRQGEVGVGEAAQGSELLVRFQAQRDGGDTDGASEELSWGQQEIWHIMQDKRTWLPIGTVLPVPAGTTVEDGVEDLRFVMSHYPSMRTRLRLDPDGPKQVVADSGEVSLEIVDVADDADPAEVAEQVRRRYWKLPYDVATDWPVRMALIRHRGVLTHRVWVMCHLVTDGAGARIILAELASRDSSGSGAALSPLELARWQHSPAGQRQCDVVLDHWERTLRSVPARRFPPRAEAPYPRYWQAHTNSPATYLGVRAISARTGVEASSVLLGIFAVALVQVTGINPVVVQVVVGNRFRPRISKTVAPIMQNGLCVIDLPNTTVDEAVAHARRRAMTAYKYAYYDPAKMAKLIRRVNRERGETVEIGCFFNDRRLRTRELTGPTPTAAEVRAAPPGTFEWKYKQDESQFDPFFINVDDEADTVAMTVLADIHHISPTDVEACVQKMEDVAVAAALDPSTRTLALAPGGGR